LIKYGDMITLFRNRFTCDEDSPIIS
jgi:hypothetical protein